MARSVVYDDSQLRLMYAALTEEQRAKALRGAFRTEATRFRRGVIGQIQSSLNSDGTPFHYTRDLDRSVRAIVYKNSLGFRVTVGTQGKTKGYHVNRKGLEKPVLMWAEDGTRPRRTKGRSSFALHGARKPQRTGAMKAYLFVEITKRHMRDSIAADMEANLNIYVAKMAKKYGCAL